MLKKTLLSLTLIIVVASLFWSSVFIQETFYETVSSVEKYASQNQFSVIVIFIVLAALSAMLSPFSSAPLVPAAVVIWGNVLTGIFLLIGWLIGATFAYLVGYYAGHPLVGRFASSGKIQHYRERLTKKTEFLLILLFRFSMPAEIPGYALGIIRYDFIKYFLATFLAELPFAFITSYASEALVFNRPAIFISLSIFAFLFIILMLYLFEKKLNQKT